MLSQKQKIEHIKFYLSQINNNYGDEIKENIFFELFVLQNYNFNFLIELETKKEIENKIEFLVSKIILNEHQDGFNNILEEYLYL